MGQSIDDFGVHDRSEGSVCLLFKLVNNRISCPVIIVCIVMSDFCGVPAYAIEVLSVCFQASRIKAVSVESIFLGFLVGA